jgi:hypothetical protein
MMDATATSKSGYEKFRFCGEEAMMVCNTFGPTPAALYRPTIDDNTFREKR